jgi:hypothetical protein
MPVSISGTDGITSPTITTTGVIVSGTTVADATAVIRPLVSATSVASTSGTSIDFTSIPSWVKRITVMFSGVSTNGSSIPLVQLGDSGGIENTGYVGTSDTIGSAGGTPTAFTAGLALGRVSTSSYERYGQAVFINISGNTWSGNYFGSSAVVLTTEQGSCAKTLSDTLTQIRITTVNGTDTFDAGSINILYE